MAKPDTSKLLGDIQRQTTVLTSAVTLIQALQQSNAEQAAQLANLKSAVTESDADKDPDLQAAIDALDASVEANTKLLESAMPAITANTPEANKPAPATDQAASGTAANEQQASGPAANQGQQNPTG